MTAKGLWWLVWGVVLAAPLEAKKPPNVVVLLADDLGVGDVGCYGNTTIRTPHIDRLAAEGARLTHHLAAAAMCTPSRAALMTSRYPSRYGLVGPDNMGTPVIVHAASDPALPLDEVTLATALRHANYTTALVGKWHLGTFCGLFGRSCPGPLNHGFQTFYGIPVTLFYEFRGNHPFWIFDLAQPKFQSLLGSWVALVVSVALGRRFLAWRAGRCVALVLLAHLALAVAWFFVAHIGINVECIWGVSPWLHRMANSLLLRQDRVVEQPIQLDGLSQRLVQESIGFLESHKDDDQPFFLFHSFGHVHTPMYTADHMKGRSRHGAYGDNVEELDEGVGAILGALERLGLDQDTIVYFSSDQGGHLEAIEPDGQRIGGHNARFKGGKVQGGTDGGLRVAGIYRYPPHIPPGTVIHTPTSLMDLMPTVLHMAGLPPVHQLVPTSPQKELDGVSIAGLLTGAAPDSAPRIFLHHCRKNVHAVRYVTGEHIYKMYLWRHKWHPGSTQCGWGHSTGCHCQLDPEYMYNLTASPHLYDLLHDPYEDHDPISPDTQEYQEVVEFLQNHLAEWHARVTYVRPQLDSLYRVMWKPHHQPVCWSCLARHYWSAS